MEGGRQATRRDCQDPEQGQEGADGGRRTMAGAVSTHRPGRRAREAGGPEAGSAGVPVCDLSSLVIRPGTFSVVWSKVHSLDFLLFSQLTMM